MYIIFQLFFAIRVVLKIGEYLTIRPERKYLMDYNFLYKPTRLKESYVNNRNGLTLK